MKEQDIRTWLLCALAAVAVAGCASFPPPLQHPGPTPLSTTASEPLDPEKREWMVERFEHFNSELSGGKGFSDRTNEAGALAWAQSPLLEAYLDMYRATRDEDYLRRFVAHADRMIANTDQERGLTDAEGRSSVAWSATRYGQGNRRVYSVHSALIVTPLLRFVHLVRSSSWLDGDFSMKARDYLELARQALAVFEDEFRIERSTREAFINLPRRGSSRDTNRVVHAPLNFDAAMGRAYLLMARASGDSTYRTRAEALAKHVRRSLMAQDDRYIWSYYCWRRWGNNPRMEDISHGSLTVAFAVEAFRAGIVFDSADIVALGRTLESMSHSGRYSSVVTGESISEPDETSSGGERLYREGDAIARWLMLLPHSPFIQKSTAVYLESRLTDSVRVHPLALLAAAKMLRHTSPEKLQE